LILNTTIPKTSLEWDSVENAVEGQEALKGFNKHNYVVQIENSFFKIRVPIPNSDKMDIRLLPEYIVQDYLHKHGFKVPSVIYVSNSPAYQVHEFLQATLVDEIAPRGKRLPSHFISDVVNLISNLQEQSSDWLLPYLENWVAIGDCNSFFDRVANFNYSLYAKYSLEYNDLFFQLGIPSNTRQILEGKRKKLSRRSFALCHCDIHRKNCLIRNDTTYFIDWELALFGDPAYDIGVHLSKIEYQSDEEEEFLELLSKRTTKTFLNGIIEDIQMYRDHEDVKAILISAIRYHKVIAMQKNNYKLVEMLLTKYRKKLFKAEPILGNKVLGFNELKKIFTNYNCKAG